MSFFIYLFTSSGGVHSYCFLLRIVFDVIFDDLLFLKCLFSLCLSVFMLTFLFYLRKFSL
ncbi:C4-dicarboxylate ABC transporter [Chrysosporum bergii ANA360D]|uniref:C4-dicarboxylate ABC transporter n=1 Tax=Chrysosporum bergii ANA360D TaxID=617107 RepID=A0AA43GWM6_9CYAN|nr:C4-dicarboxylate ABC transporter [Chrysosporum bergii]MDH6062193.1 C4-dicarboxylate ABC transporter [Chrysosporum bergii ANA360D]